MNDNKLYELIKQRQILSRQLPQNPKIIKGSLVEARRVCGKPNCRCQKGEKHASLYLSVSCAGKTRMTYIPKKLETQVKQAVKRYKQLLRIVEELSELNLRIIKYRQS
jgi:hypothetical protein